jgi:hypothetical protein
MQRFSNFKLLDSASSLQGRRLIEREPPHKDFMEGWKHIDWNLLVSSEEESLTVIFYLVAELRS